MRLPLPEIRLLLLGLLAPAAFWIGYLYYKDRYRPEPLVVVGVAYLLGVVAGFLCLQGYVMAEDLGLPADPMGLAETDPAAFLVYCLGFVGVVEELFKCLPLVLVVMHLRVFDEVIDGIVYASSIALGFATFENLSLLPALEGAEQYGRAFASPLIHTMFSSIWGYAIAVAKLGGKPVWPAALAGLAIAALVHGVYDFLTVNPALRLGAALLILAVWIWRIRTISKLHAGAPGTTAQRDR